MRSKEEYIKEAEELIKADNNRGIDDKMVKFPSWLKLEPSTFQFYFKWKTQGFTKGIGWHWNTEIVKVGEPIYGN